MKYSLLLWAVIATLLGAFYLVIAHQKYAAFVIEETNELEIVQNRLIEEQNSTIEDLFLFSKMEETRQLLQGDQAAKELVEYAASLLMESRGYYDQLRILDRDGMEKVRINFLAGNSVIVPESEMQDKSERYYYLDAKDLLPGEVYISPLDLNVEQGEIEIPYKPMIRYVRVVYDEENAVMGYIVINYLANRIFERLDESVEQGDSTPCLVNQNGYYLYCSNPEMLWGFQIPEHSGFNLSQEDPTLWAMMHENASGHITRKNHTRFFRSFSITSIAAERIAELMGPDRTGPVTSGKSERYWFLVKDVNQKQWFEYIKFLRQVILLLGLAGILLVPILSIAFARVNEANDRMQEQLKKNATYDSLTGAYNRNAGFELTEHMVKLAKRTKETFVICYIDLNNLKLVNDNYGHDLGDRFITGLIDALRQSIRDTDSIIRLGGDEFLVLLPRCDEAKAVEILKRADAILQEKGKMEASPVPWSFSFGCIPFSGDESKDTDELIREADALMYKHKQERKAKQRSTGLEPGIGMHR